MAFHSDLHAKFIVIDDKYALVGSANVTHSGLSPDSGKFVFDGQKAKEWQMAALIAYLNRRESNVYIATAKVLGYVEDGTSKHSLKPSLSPPKVGLPVKKASREDLLEIMPNGQESVSIGVFAGTDIEVSIDLEEIKSKHMAILGTTGSGKSYFAKRFIAKASKHLNHIYILDPHGEYAGDFREFGFEDFEEVKVPNTVLFFSPGKIEDFLKDYRSGNRQEVQRRQGPGGGYSQVGTERQPGKDRKRTSAGTREP